MDPAIKILYYSEICWVKELHISIKIMSRVLADLKPPQYFRLSTFKINLKVGDLLIAFYLGDHDCLG